MCSKTIQELSKTIRKIKVFDGLTLYLLTVINHPRLLKEEEISVTQLKVFLPTNRDNSEWNKRSIGENIPSLSRTATPKPQERLVFCRLTPNNMLLFPLRNTIFCLEEKLKKKIFDKLIYTLSFVPALSTSTKPKYTPRKRLVTSF